MSEIKSEHDKGKLVTITRAHYDVLVASHQKVLRQQSHHEAMRNGPDTRE